MRYTEKAFTSRFFIQRGSEWKRKRRKELWFFPVLPLATILTLNWKRNDKSQEQRKENYHIYHPTSGLTQILHFNSLRYLWTNSNSHRVAKFAGFSFVFFPNKHFFQLAFPNFIIAFSVRLVG